VEKKTSKNILLIIMGVLILASIAITICSITWSPVLCGLALVVLVFVALYGFVLYKKPHGNMLKYAMLLFAAVYIISAIIIASQGDGIVAFSIIGTLAASAIFYGAGRLNRIEQNKFVFVIADIIFFVLELFTAITCPTGSFTGTFVLFNYFIIFTTLIIAYFVRYKEHREAGLNDAPKKK